MKWGTKFGPEYVNRLRSMVARHLSLQHRFVCFTDNSEGIGSGVEILPLPIMDLADDKRGGWRKLSTFTSPLENLVGPTLFLDVDLVIVDSIDCFFDHPGKFCIIHDWARPWRITGNSSVYRFQANAHPDIYAKFLATSHKVISSDSSDQVFLSREMHRQGLLTYWPKDWCVSFKHSCLPIFPMNLLRVPQIPNGARIIVFHGVPNPEEALAGKGKNCFRKAKPTPWVAIHWQ